MKIITLCACPTRSENELTVKEIEEATVVIVAVGENVADILEDAGLK